MIENVLSLLAAAPRVLNCEVDGMITLADIEAGMSRIAFETKIDRRRYIACDRSYFGAERLEVTAFAEDDPQCSAYADNTIAFIQSELAHIYGQILRAVLFWQNECGLTWEVYNPKQKAFEEKRFRRSSEIRPYLGRPMILILNQYVKDGLSCYAACFYQDCLLAMERGLTAVFCKGDLIDIDAADWSDMLTSLTYEEPDCSLWKKDRWKIKLMEGRRKRIWI